MNRFSPLARFIAASFLGLIWCIMLFITPGRSEGFFEYLRDLFIPPSQLETAGSNRSAGSRDECSSRLAPNLRTEERVPLTALVPKGNAGRTLEAHPTFWVYMPYTTQSFQDSVNPEFRRVEFVLIDAVEEGIEETVYGPVNLALPDHSNLYAVQIPETISLETERQYRWVLSVQCNIYNRSGDATVNGWIERVELDEDLERELSIASAQEQIRLYGEEKLWYNMLTNLVRYHHLDNPQDAAAAIRDQLLEFVGLCKKDTDSEQLTICPLEE